ncbi:MAG: hypothetical protein HYV26_09090 [Candidatus Hydrogenedentes bacterium]|nr:hypothetical protein [Candidatus Hydrogenedentota bacterium]
MNKKLMDGRQHKGWLPFDSGILCGLAVYCALFLCPGCTRLKESLSPVAVSEKSKESDPAVTPVEVQEAAETTPYPEEPRRRVGIAYELWFPPQSWDNAWSLPQLGKYDSSDTNVIRQHAEWLADAGVDFIWIDWSNNVAAAADPGLQSIERATETLFAVYAGLKDRPQISIFLGIDGNPAHLENGGLQRKADQIYDSFAAVPEYRNLLIQYLGKPLLVIYAGTPCPWRDRLPRWDDPRFTVRWMTGFLDDQPSLRTGDGASAYGYWSWWDRTPQSFARHEGVPENCAVSAAYPGYTGWDTEGTAGRRAGETFREQWAHAREIDPCFVLVNSWNEWTPPEEVDPEFSNDLEPSEEFADQYLALLKEEIAAWKDAPASETPEDALP